jgi:hypothetical protein
VDGTFSLLIGYQRGPPSEGRHVILIAAARRSMHSWVGRVKRTHEMLVNALRNRNGRLPVGGLPANDPAFGLFSPIHLKPGALQSAAN